MGGLNPNPRLCTPMKGTGTLYKKNSPLHACLLSHCVVARQTSTLKALYTGPSSVNQVDNTCDDRRLIYHSDRPALSTARCRRAGPSATADACSLAAAVQRPHCTRECELATFFSYRALTREPITTTPNNFCSAPCRLVKISFPDSR